MSRLYHSLECYIYHERLWYNLLISWPSCYGLHWPTNSAMNWSRFSGVGYGTLFHSRQCWEIGDESRSWNNLLLNRYFVMYNMWLVHRLDDLSSRHGTRSYCTVQFVPIAEFGDVFLLNLTIIKPLLSASDCRIQNVNSLVYSTNISNINTHMTRCRK